MIMAKGQKSEMDKGETSAVEAVATVDETLARYENSNPSKESATVEDIISDIGTGTVLNLSTGDMATPAPDGGKGWLIVFAASILLSFSVVQPTLQPQTLAFFGLNAKINMNRSNLFSSELEIKLDELMRKLLLSGNTSLLPDIVQVLRALNNTEGFQNLITSKQQEMVDEANITAMAAHAERVALQALMGTVVTTQQVLFSISGLISASLILAIGYRLVTLAGGVIIGLGCLSAAFCDNSNIHLVSFFYGAIPGIGQNMVTVSCIVAVTEYFKKRRVIALLIPFLISVALVLSIQLLQIFVVQNNGLKGWRNYLFLQTGIAGAMMLTSLILKPLNLKMKDEANVSFLSRLLGTGRIYIYRRPVLYSYSLVWFLSEGGFAIINAKLPMLRGIELIPLIPLGQILLMILGLGSLIGFCVPCCITNRITLKITFLIISVQLAASSIINFVGSQLYDYIFAVVFASLLGFVRGFTGPLLLNAIPPLLGENNLAIATGVVTMAQGIGGLTMPMAAEKIQKMTERFDECFYLAGGLFLAGSLFTVLSYQLFRKSDQAEITKPTDSSCNVAQ